MLLPVFDLQNRRRDPVYLVLVPCRHPTLAHYATASGRGPARVQYKRARRMEG